MELVANRSVIEAELRKALRSRRSNRRNSVLLLHAAPQWHGDETRFEVDVDGRPVPVIVAPCATVLALLDALSATRAEGEHLVILTQCAADEVGDSVLARALQPEIKPIDRWDLVRDAFGARQLDPLLTKARNSWIAEALLDAQPAGGWRRLGGPVLAEATALSRLAATRLGIDDDATVDAAALLEWTTDSGRVTGFLALRQEERDGLTGWLTRTAGPVADIVFRMAAAGRVTDAVPFGLVAVAVYDPGPAIAEIAFTARIRAEERYLDRHPASPEALRAFGEAAESLVTRWSDNGRAARAAGLRERAERILADLTGSEDGTRTLAGRSRVLDAGFDARLAAFAAAFGAAVAAVGSRAQPGAAAQGQAAPTALTQAAAALIPLREHAQGRAGAHGRDRAAEVSAAEAAVRLARWLAAPEPAPATLSDAAAAMLRSWAWADQALAAVIRADTSRAPGLAGAYASLCETVRARRAGLDEEFARKLAAWTEASSSTDSLLLVENVLDRVARPLAAKRPPVIVVLDGMTAAIGAQLAGDLTDGGGWIEAGRQPDGREPALATVPSVTSVSRASLLTGTLRTGGQAEERSGFAAFWGRQPAELFHKADLAPAPGRALADRVRDAILDSGAVVGVVLNTIDDTLDRGKPGPARWTPGDVTFLREILDEARRAGRPVILTADHGHVLNREQPAAPGQPSAQGSRPQAAEPRPDSARYRTGVPGPGEITVRGPRVRLPKADAWPDPARPGPDAGAAVVAAVSESIHYTPRKAGYHGGAAAAEVVVPVITLLPLPSLVPAGWFAYDPIGHAPAWWDAPSAGTSAVRPPAAAGGKQAAGRRKRPASSVPDDPGALFGIGEVAAGTTGQDRPAGPGSGVPTPGGTGTPGPGASLGARVAASARMSSQREFVRRGPDGASVAALVDALDQAGGSLTMAEAARAVGESPVRMSRYLTQVARLLNVDGYAVLRITDEGRTVQQNTSLLREQFAV